LGRSPIDKKKSASTDLGGEVSAAALAPYQHEASHEAFHEVSVFETYQPGLSLRL
jgi:hypothetical protein